MGWQFTVLSTPTLLALAVSVFLLGYIATVYRERRGDPIVVLYFWMTVAAIVWTGFSALKLFQTDPAAKLLLYRSLHVGAAVLPPLLFLFVIAFTDRTHWLRSEYVGAVFVVPVVFLVFLFFGPSGLVIGDRQLTEGDLVILRVANGPGFYLFSVYSLALVVATLGIVLFESRRVGPTYYPQAGLIAVAVVAPTLFGILTAADVPPFVDDRVNLVPTSAAISVLSLGILLYRYRLVDLPPLAYTTAMKYSPDALFVLNQDGQVVSTNDRGGELLDRLDGRPGEPLSEAVPGFDPESTAAELLELAPSPGEQAYKRVFVEPLTRGGERVGWVVVLRDETEQQRQQRQLQRKNEQMEVFASTISHDLRNPLNVAQLNLELARDTFESEELDNIENAHARMQEIIEEVLLLARAGNRIDDLEAVPIQLVVDRAWENVTTPAAQLAVEVDHTVMADPTMFQHVFENLFRNAVEHGGEDVVVTVGPLGEGLYVEDDGAGIPPDDRETVFEVGYTRATDGTGLGLSITEQIVTAHGWDVRVTEGTDGGARFEITGVETVA